VASPDHSPSEPTIGVAPPRLDEIIRGRGVTALRVVVRGWTPAAVAEAIEDLTAEDQVIAFRLLPRDVATDAFEYLPRDVQEGLVHAMAKEDVGRILNGMSADDRTMLLEELPAAATQQLLNLLSPEERATAVKLLGYPEGSIGRLMTPDYVRVRPEWTMEHVLDHLRRHGHDSETLSVVYVINEVGRLAGEVGIRKVLLAAPSTTVAEVMTDRVVALQATDREEAAVAIFRREGREALPVTDTAGVLIGIVTIDDVLDVAQTAATADQQQFGGVQVLEEPYMDVTLPQMVRKRAGWLVVLFLGEMLTATAMSFYEHEIARAVVLALFVPLIISSGGNSGSQAATLVIRALALGEVGLRDWWRVVWREVLVGLSLGVILGSIGFARITGWSVFSSLYGEHWLLVAVTVSLALVGIVLWGTLAGSTLPFVLKRLGFDPASSSAPFVATLVDVTGLIIYFSVAAIILRGTLL